MIFKSKARGEMFRSLVDTEAGEVVVRQGLTVTATIDAAGIAAGSHADMITFTNASTGAGNTTRAAALTVVADANANRLPDDWDAEYGLTAGDTALADRDGDGVPNVFEHALCLNPTASDGDEGYWTTTETNPADDKRYLVLHYRRRLSLVGWAIDVETSMNASQWSSLPGATEPSQAPTPLPGGIAEIAHVRVLQPMGSGGSERAFVRLKIRSLYASSQMRTPTSPAPVRPLRRARRRAVGAKAGGVRRSRG